MDDPGGPRLLLQYLEPSPAVDAAAPGQLRDHLAAALDRVPVSDVALGWRLPLEVIEAVGPGLASPDFWLLLSQPVVATTATATSQGRGGRINFLIASSGRRTPRGSARSSIVRAGL